VLATLNDELNKFELSTNDTKTKVIPTSLPSSDLWPFELHRLAHDFFDGNAVVSERHLMELINCALICSKQQKSQSPIKLLLRLLDKFHIEKRNEFGVIEFYLMRFVSHFAHAIDYICMIVGARALAGEPIDRAQWKEVIEKGITRYARLRQHHEVAWLLWLSIVAGLEIDARVAEAAMRTENAHVCSMIVRAYSTGRMTQKPEVKLPGKLDMTSENWLLFHEATLADWAKPSLFENDELGIHLDLISHDESFINFSIGEDRLRTGASVIDGVRFGYDLDDEITELQSGEAAPRIFVPSTQDF
jgi:hypothetical protein